MKKTFTLALGIIAGLCLASTLYNANARRNLHQIPPGNPKQSESEPDEYSLWI